MAPKSAPLTPEMESLVAYFESCGLSPTRALETVKNAKTSSTALPLFKQNNLHEQKLTDKQGMLVLQIAKDGVKLDEEKKDYLVGLVVAESLKTGDQITAAVKYLAANPAFPVDQAAFDKSCGIGFTATPEEIFALVRDQILSLKSSNQITGWQQFQKVSGQLRLVEELKWANVLAVRESAEKIFKEIWGEKVAPGAGGEKKPVVAPTKVATPSSSSTTGATAVESPEQMFSTGWISRLHVPGGNEQKYPERMAEHLKATGGKVRTRFPPEPNGFLHIGHSKAIAVNFGYAKYHGGHCYLRFDDTNPEAEEQIYFDKILEAVRWLGYEPYGITHSSDHFGELYDFAKVLIEKGLAYTSNDTAAEIQSQRGGPKDGPHGPRHDSKDRAKPIPQSLAEFEDMKLGKYKPGEMTLRLKQDMNSGNPVMWDIIAYRVLETPHHRTGTTWKIYPTYDFTHCICDSFENISHSLCTTEFIMAREAYEWVCDSLEIYKPRQSEYGRLSLEGTITSKRKLLRLVKEGHVSGWDDPRLYTLVALKRRGVPPQAIINFVSNLGISTSASHVQLSRFEQTVRQYLETTTPRLMMVLHPVRITLSNLPSSYLELVSKPIHPKNPSMGTNSVPFTSTIFIDQSDFKSVASPDFFRLSPGATVGLLNVPHPITYVSHSVDEEGNVKEIICKYDDSADAPKPKAWIQWVALHPESNSPMVVDETRIFSRLFNCDDPAKLSDEEYVKDIRKDSLERVEGAMLEVGVWKVIKDSMEEVKKVVEARKKEAEKKGTDAPPMVEGVEAIRFQGLRTAYFALDLDSDLTERDGGGVRKLVLNQITALKAAKGA